MTNLEAREAEARREFPLGAVQTGFGWTATGVGYEEFQATGPIGLGYLPLEAPGSPCPECHEGVAGEDEQPCPTCHGTGFTPGDSILSRLRKGEWP